MEPKRSRIETKTPVPEEGKIYWECELESNPILRYISELSTAEKLPTEFPPIEIKEGKSKKEQIQKLIESRRIETKHLPYSIEPKESKCSPTRKVTPYLTEGDCNKSCNLLLQIPPEILFQIGLMEPRDITELLPLISETVRSVTEPEVSALRRHYYAREGILKSLNRPAIEALTELKERFVARELGDIKENLPLIFNGLQGLLRENKELVDDPLFTYVLNRSITTGIRNKLNSDVAKMYDYLGGFYFDEGNFTKAIENFIKSSSLRKSFEPYYMLGYSYFAIDNFSKSLENYNIALSLEKQPRAYLGRGRTYFNLKDYKRAIQDFNKIIENYKTLQELLTSYYYRGLSYYRENKLDDALRDLSNFLEYKINHEHPVSNAYNTIGLIYSAKGNYPKAVSEFATALSHMEKPDYYYNRAIAYRDGGNNVRALADIERAITLSPQDSDFYSLGGSVLTNLNRLEEAKRFLEIASKLGASNDVFYIRRAKYWEKVGTINKRSGAIENAIADYQRALSLNPNNLSAQEGLKKLTSVA